MLANIFWKYFLLILRFLYFNLIISFYPGIKNIFSSFDHQIPFSRWMAPTTLRFRMRPVFSILRLDKGFMFFAVSLISYLIFSYVFPLVPQISYIFVAFLRCFSALISSVLKFSHDLFVFNLNPDFWISIRRFAGMKLTTRQRLFCTIRFFVVSRWKRMKIIPTRSVVSTPTKRHLSARPTAQPTFHCLVTRFHWWPLVSWLLRPVQTKEYTRSWSIGCIFYGAPCLKKQNINIVFSSFGEIFRWYLM